MRSFYVTNEIHTLTYGEYQSLKDAEKAVRTMLPGEYLIAEVVRRATISSVPETVRVQMSATRTRAPKDPNAPRQERKPHKPKLA